LGRGGLAILQARWGQRRLRRAILAAVGVRHCRFAPTLPTNADPMVSLVKINVARESEKSSRK
jgi:hypothetical protein